MKTTNVNIKIEPCDIYCGRGTGIKNDPLKCSIGEYGWLGNPVAIGYICPVCNLVHSTGGSTLACYEIYLRKRLEDQEFLAEFKKLEGKSLGCFCKPKPCHTDIIIKILEELKN